MASRSVSRNRASSRAPALLQEEHIAAPVDDEVKPRVPRTSTSTTSSSSTSSTTPSSESEDILPCEPTTPPTPAWKLADLYLPILIGLLCCYTRFWNIHLPSGIVFDELHFGKFVNWTLFHWMYFDIHPPFAKLTLAYLAHLWGYKAHLCDYEPPAGQSRYYAENPASLASVQAGGPPCQYWKLRAIVAAFSVGACLLMYYSARRLGGSVSAAGLAFLLETFNMLHNVEGRLVLLNTQLLFWLNASLYTGLCWFAAANAHARAGTAMGWRERAKWVVVVGVCGGNALSIKHTGLGTPAMIALEGGLGLFFLTRPIPLLDLVAYAGVMFVTYTTWFAFHFWNFVHSHRELHQEEEFMSPAFQRILVNSSTYDPRATNTDGFWKTFTTFNIRMVVHSAAITQPHAWGTRPWEWIWNARGVSYWGSTMGGGPDDKASIYLMGNPVENWGIIAALGALLVLLFVQLRTAWYAPKANYLVDWFRAGRPASPPATTALLFAIASAQVGLCVRYMNDPSALGTSAGVGGVLCAGGAWLVASGGGATPFTIPSPPKRLFTGGVLLAGWVLGAVVALGAGAGLVAIVVPGVGVEGGEGYTPPHSSVRVRAAGALPLLTTLVAGFVNGWRGWAPSGLEGGVGEGGGVFFKHTPLIVLPAAAAAAGAAAGTTTGGTPRLHLNTLILPALWCVFGWLVNLVPYAAINRTTFAYHYMPALVYGNLLLALMVDRLGGVAGGGFLGGLAGAVWLFYRPWIFGYGLTEDEHARRRWLERWN